MKLTSPDASEFNLIFDSWARSFMKSPWAGCIRNCDYDQVSRAAMAELVDRPARVTVAVEDLEDGTRRVLGYSVSEPDRKVIHYVYVKRDARGLGIGRTLRRDVVADADREGWSYTYKTNASDRFLRGLKHQPALARVK